MEKNRLDFSCKKCGNCCRVGFVYLKKSTRAPKLPFMPDRFSIRFAVAADVAAVHALIERSYRGEVARRGWTHEADLLEGQRTGVDEIAALVSDSRSRILMLEDLGELVGCVHIADRGNGACYLGMLCVDPGRQAAGLGKQLMSAAETFGRQLFGATRMEMTVIEQRAELIPLTTSAAPTCKRARGAHCRSDRILRCICWC